MAYFQKNQKRNRVLVGGSIREQHSSNESKVPHQCKKESQSRQSYLKAFKKYYIEKLQDRTHVSNYLQNQENNSQLFHFNDTRTQCQRLEQTHQKSVQLTEKFKHSIMTDSTKNSRQKPSSKMSRSKIVNLVDSKDCQIEQLLYSSINEVEREMMVINNVNDMAIENKMLKNSILKLKQLLKEKLQVALKKNKEELTAMFDEYSTMIKKLLEDKEELTIHLEKQKERYAREEKIWKNIEDSYENKIAIIVEENAVQIRNTKKQVEEFLEMIIEYEEQGNKEKIQLQNLREKVVELQMENDRLKNERDSYENTGKSSTLNIDEKKLEKYSQKIEILLQMMDQMKNQNEQLKQFLKSCKCSRLKSEMIQSHSSNSSENIKEIISRYEKQLIQAEKDYLFEEEQIRQVLKKKDQCIERLNLIISQLRKARYTSVDKMTEDFLEKQLLQEQI